MQRMSQGKNFKRKKEMTAKEKAVELLEEFDDAKQCALIAIDEILKIKGDCHDLECYSEPYTYWKEVKTEIEKL